MKKLTALALMGASLSFTQYSFATVVATNHDGSITFNGKIVDQSCQVETNSQNLTVQLPTVSKSVLNAKGKTAGETPFTISLTNCKGVNQNQGTTVRLFFLPDGSKVDLANKVLRNTHSRSAASNVGVQITSSTSEPIPLGQGIDQYTQASDKVALSQNVALNYKARYYATGTAGAGNVQSTVQFNVVYD